MMFFCVSEVGAQDTTFVRSLPLKSFVRNIDTDGESLYLRMDNDIYIWKNENLDYLQEGKFKHSWVQYDTKRNLKVINHNYSISKEDQDNAKRLANLLPGDYNYNTTSCLIGNTLYVCYNGVVLQYRITPGFMRYHRGNSIRHVYSEPGLRVISTYNGIFVDTIFDLFSSDKLKNRLANYSNGELAKINSNYYLCQDNLLSFEPSTLQFKTVLNTEGTPRLRKLIAFKGNTYALYDKAFGTIDLNSGERTYLVEEEVTDVLEFKDKLFVSSLNSILYELDSSGSIRTYMVDAPINDLTTNGEDLFLGTTIGLFKKVNDEFTIVIPDTEIVQSLFFEDKIVFTNNQGLYFFNDETVTGLIENIEFNKMALNLDEHFLYAGSVNGLYVIRIFELNAIISNSPVRLRNNKVIVLITIGLCLFFAASIVFYHIRKKKRKQLEIFYTSKKVPINSDTIQKAIREHPKIQSVSLLAEHFNTSVVQINRYLKKENLTGLMLLKSIMRDIAREMHKKGHTIAEISKRVGYSERYIKSKFLKEE
jgi:AraC-like DNA-binding protein